MDDYQSSMEAYQRFYPAVRNHGPTPDDSYYRPLDTLGFEQMKSVAIDLFKYDQRNKPSDDIKEEEWVVLKVEGGLPCRFVLDELEKRLKAAKLSIPSTLNGFGNIGIFDLQEEGGEKKSFDDLLRKSVEGGGLLFLFEKELFEFMQQLEFDGSHAFWIKRDFFAKKLPTLYNDLLIQEYGNKQVRSELEIKASPLLFGKILDILEDYGSLIKNMKALQQFIGYKAMSNTYDTTRQDLGTLLLQEELDISRKYDLEGVVIMIDHYIAATPKNQMTPYGLYWLCKMQLETSLEALVPQICDAFCGNTPVISPFEYSTRSIVQEMSPNILRRIVLEMSEKLKKKKLKKIKQRY